MGECRSFQPILAISHLLDSSNFSGCELISPGFEFPWWLQLLSIFSCVYWPSVQLLYRNVYWKASAIYSTGLFVFLLSYNTSLHILDAGPWSYTYDTWFVNIFSHLWVVFSLSQKCLLKHRSFQFWISPICLSFISCVRS